MIRAGSSDGGLRKLYSLYTIQMHPGRIEDRLYEFGMTDHQKKM